MLSIRESNLLSNFLLFIIETMIKVTEKKGFFVSWIVWHYVVVLKEIILSWKDFLFFNLNYFSIFRLLTTFFSPWRKYKTSYGRGFDLKRYAEAIIFNTFSRLIGMIMRIFLIITGVLTEIFIFITGILFVVFWLFIPVIIITGLFLSIRWILTFT